jgi:plastocyanin
LVIAKATPSGDGQTATVATALPSQLRVEVTDNGSPVSGRTVAWATTGGGSVTASSDTDASGIATSQWTLGQSAGLQSASATLSGAGGSPIGFTASASAGAAASIGKATPSGDGQSGMVNTVLANPLVARVADQFDNPVSGVSVMWQVTQGTATAAPASGNTASNGEASTMVALLGTPGPIIIQAMSMGLSGSPLDYSATAQAPPMAVTVQVVDNSFQPQDVTIAVGGTVTWNWPSSNVATHNVMPDVTGGPPLRSGDPTLGPFTHQVMFNTAGTYMYYCFVHGQPGGGIGMVGTVTVI